jgi:hypothetical protein
MEMDFQIVRSISGRLSVKRRPPAEVFGQIDVRDPAQVAHWCRELGVTWLELFSAIERVGTDIAAVRLAVRLPSR